MNFLNLFKNLFINSYNFYIFWKKYLSLSGISGKKTIIWKIKILIYQTIGNVNKNVRIVI